MTAAEPLITARGLRFGRGPGLCWSLPAWTVSGGMHGLCGPSGSGKSTLLSTLSGLLAPLEGQLHVVGRPLHELDPLGQAQLRAGAVALVPQEPALIGWMSVAHNVALHRRLAGGAPDPAALSGVLGALELAGLRGRPAGALSGGERKRVGLARAIYSGVPLILADEPSAGLDPERAAAAVELLSAHGSVAGQAVVLASHAPAVLRACAQTVDVSVLRVRP